MSSFHQCGNTKDTSKIVLTWSSSLLSSSQDQVLTLIVRDYHAHLWKHKTTLKATWVNQRLQN
jgi:hypothetical protein